MPIADFGAQLETTVDNVEESDEILDRNKDLILDYKRDQVLNGLSEATLLQIGRASCRERVSSPV